MAEKIVAKLSAGRGTAEFGTAEGIKMPSYEAYVLGELETYTESTLKLVKRDVEADAGIVAKMNAAEASI